MVKIDGGYAVGCAPYMEAQAPPFDAYASPPTTSGFCQLLTTTSNPTIPRLAYLRHYVRWPVEIAAVQFGVWASGAMVGSRRLRVGLQHANPANGLPADTIAQSEAFVGTDCLQYSNQSLIVWFERPVRVYRPGPILVLLATERYQSNLGESGGGLRGLHNVAYWPFQGASAWPFQRNFFLNTGNVYGYDAIEDDFPEDVASAQCTEVGATANEFPNATPFLLCNRL